MQFIESSKLSINKQKNFAICTELIKTVLSYALILFSFDYLPNYTQTAITDELDQTLRV